MPKRTRTRSKSRDPEHIERDFMEAIERLKVRKPNLQEFKDKIARGKVVPINTLNVSKEAGRARALIATDNPRYQRVRETIRLEAGGETDYPRTQDALVRKLRRDIADLRADLKAAVRQQTAALTERDEARKNERRERSRRERVERERDKSQRELAARTETNVVSLHGDDWEQE